MAELAGSSESVEIEGALLEYRFLGAPPSEAPTLVFLHEGLGSAAQWRDLPDALAVRSGCGALVYSRAGYGRSSPAVEPRPTSFMHDEARRTLPMLLARFAIRRPMLFGHSDGASIALIYAGSGCSPPPRAVIVEAPHAVVEPVCLASIRALAEAFDSATAAGAALRARFARHHGEQSERTVRSWVDVWLRHEFAAWSIEEMLPAIDCPVLAIQGENDAYGTPLQLDLLRAGVAGPVETHLLAACGHAPHRDRPEAVLSFAESFVARLAG